MNRARCNAARRLAAALLTILSALPLTACGSAPTTVMARPNAARPAATASATATASSTVTPRATSSKVNLRRAEPKGRHAAPSLAARANATMNAYMLAVNEQDLRTAYTLLSPRMRGKNPYTRWARDTSTSALRDLSVANVQAAGSGARADVMFTSTQSAWAGPDGETCTDWSLTYRFIAAGSKLLIDGARGSHKSCPPDSTPADPAPVEAQVGASWHPLEFHEFWPGVAFRWVHDGRCNPWAHCVQAILVTRDGCPTGLYAKVGLYQADVQIDYADDQRPSVPAMTKIRLTFSGPDTDWRARMEEIVCT